MPKLRWDCGTDGCFNVLRRPRIEEFDTCFPGNITMGDVDAMVEINGAFCLMEWKGQGGSVSMGQHIAYQHFTHDGRNAVFVVEGDCVTMLVRRYRLYFTGQRGDWIVADLHAVRRRLMQWVRFARRRAA